MAMLQLGHRIVGISAVLLLLAVPSLGQTRPDWVFPGSSWATRSVEELGLDRAALEQLRANLTQNSSARESGGVVVKDGYLVYSWGDFTGSHNWASASKPMVSTLLFAAIHEARVDSVDSLARDWDWELRPEDQSMTFRHLANMTSGYAVTESPGERWAYNDYAIQLYINTLDHVFGTTDHLVTAGTQRILVPLEFQDGRLFESGKGRVRSSARDFARVGWMWTNRGAWQGRQLLPTSLFDLYMQADVAASTPRTVTSNSDAVDYLGVGSYGGGVNQTSRGPGYYGFTWWFNQSTDGSRLAWPSAPADTFQANGRWGKEAVTAMPSLGLLVAAWNDDYAAWGDERQLSPGSPSSRMNKNLKIMVASAANVTDRSWQVDSGDWSVAEHWDPGGGVAGLPDSLRRARVDNGGRTEITSGGAETKALYVGEHHSGTVAMRGGALTATNVVVGYRGDGVFEQSGGVSTFDGLHIALGATSTGVYRLEEGLLSASSILGGEGEGTLRFLGGTLRAGEIGFSLVHEAGVLAPGQPIGTTFVNGDYTQSDTAVLQVEIAESASQPGTGWDLLEIRGAAELAGAVEIVFVGADRPNEGETFEIISATFGIHASGLQLRGAHGFEWSLGDNNTVLRLEYVGSLMAPAFIRGNCNDDSEIDISDAVCILEWRFEGAAAPGCVAGTNTNGDEAVDLTDAVWLLEYLFQGGPLPTAPFPDCGPSGLTADGLLGCITPPKNCRP